MLNAAVIYCTCSGLFSPMDNAYTLVTIHDWQISTSFKFGLCREFLYMEPYPMFRSEPATGND